MRSVDDAIVDPRRCFVGQQRIARCANDCAPAAGARLCAPAGRREYRRRRSASRFAPRRTTIALRPSATIVERNSLAPFRDRVTLAPRSREARGSTCPAPREDLARLFHQRIDRMADERARPHCYCVLHARL